MKQRIIWIIALLVLPTIGGCHYLNPKAAPEGSSSPVEHIDKPTGPSGNRTPLEISKVAFNADAECLRMHNPESSGVCRVDATSVKLHAAAVCTASVPDKEELKITIRQRGKYLGNFVVSCGTVDSTATGGYSPDLFSPAGGDVQVILSPSDASISYTVAVGVTK